VGDVVKVLAPIAAVAVLSAFRLAGSHPGWLVVLLLLCAASGSAGVYRQLTMRVELHRDELIAVNWRSHRIARSEVIDVEVGRVVLTARAHVRTRDGRRTTLSALDGRRVAGDAARFAAEVACVREWWRGGGA
jgi:hypothetical protein